MSNVIELRKRCPFCGETGCFDPDGPFIMCDGCSASGPAMAPESCDPDDDGDTEGAAWAFWNQRAESSPVGGERGWIPVGERLPPDVRHQVLVVRGEPGAKPWVGGAYYRGPKRPGERRRGDWEVHPWGIVADVTHWMPLPEPPAAGKDGGK